MDQAGLLAGTRILDLAGDNADFCSMVLANLGADVIKIEKPGENRLRKTVRYICHNANKRSITLDLETEKGRKQFFRLSKKADVIVESFAPGYLRDIGCSFEKLSERNPRLILASVTGFGQKGPRSDWRGSDLVISAYGGHMYVTGEASSFPLKLHGSQTGYVASLFAAVGILLALIRRNSSGTGEHLDISAQEAACAALDHVLVRYWYNGDIPVRQGDLAWNRSSFILPCKDGHIFISIAGHWETLTDWMASEGMAEDLAEEKWKDESFRSAHIDHVRDVLRRWTLTHHAGELVEIAQAMRMPWAPVCRPLDVLKSPQLKAREFFRSLAHPETGQTILVPGMPYKFRSPGSSPAGHAPAPVPEQRNVRRGAPDSNSRNILKGIRVLDFTWVLAGPYATRLLADFGAEVIKVQSLKTSRKPEANLDGYFCTWNRNKKSITLDMGQAEARELFLRLAAISDVVIENFSPRVMANWGLTYDTLKSVNERLIMVSMSAMGQTGPWRDYVAFGPALHAFSGLTWLTSYGDGRPIGPGFAYGDHVFGLYGALGVLSALEHRTRTGCGMHVDLSGYEALCSVMGPVLAEASLDRGPSLAPEHESDDADAGLSGCYRCRGEDRWCVISVSSEDEWTALCRVLDHPDWLSDRRFRTAEERKKHRQDLEAEIERWTLGRTAEEAAAMLQQAGVPAGVVQNAEDLLHDPHLAARKFFAEMEHPALGSTLADKPPAGFPDVTADQWKAAPLLGEDNRYVFVELLGLSEKEFLHYKEKGIIA